MRTTVRMWLTLILVLLGWSTSLWAAPTAEATTGWWRIEEDTTLTEDHVGNIYVGDPGVTLDCDGHTVSPGAPSGYHGILVDAGAHDATVRDCHVWGFGNGITVYYADRALIVGNDAFGNSGAGIVVAESSHTRVVQNTTNENGDNGIQVESSLRVVVARNTTSGNLGTGGVATLRAINGVFRANVVRGNTHAGFNLGASPGSSVVDNLVRGNEVGIWLEMTDDSVVEGNLVRRSRAEGVSIRGGTGNVVGVNVLKNPIGGGGGIILYEGATRNRVEFNRVRAAFRGVTLVRASDNVIRRNAFRSSLSEGILLAARSRSNLIKRNLSIGSAAIGISLEVDTSDNVLVRNVSCGSGTSDAKDDAAARANDWIDNRICDREP